MNTIAPSSAALAQNGSYLGPRHVLAVHVAADRHAAQPQALHAVLELLRRQVGKLQRHRRHGDEAIRVRDTHFASASFCVLTIAVARLRSAAYHQ